MLHLQQLQGHNISLQITSHYVHKFWAAWALLEQLTRFGEETRKTTTE